MSDIKRDKKQKIRKMAVTILAAILLVCLYVVIFRFSDQNGETSGSVSREVTEVIIKQVDKMTGRKWTADMKAALVEYWEHPVRKLGHFSEYALMAVILFVMWIPWIPRKKRFYFLIIMWVFLSAAFDEAHQLFVAGRSGNPLDVMLDTGGGCFGLLVSTIICTIILRVRNRKKGK